MSFREMTLILAFQSSYKSCSAANLSICAAVNRGKYFSISSMFHKSSERPGPFLVEVNDSFLNMKFGIETPTTNPAMINVQVSPL